jgi:hypothetical protein
MLQGKKMVDEDWENIRKTIVFKPNKIVAKEGIEKIVNDIRVALNKISVKNYETQMQHIYKLLLIEPLPETLEYFKKITVALDKKRKQDASAVLPHLFNR